MIPDANKHGGPVFCSVLNQEMSRNIDKYEQKVENINKALATLIEAQKNTTKNLDTLTEDVKKIMDINSSLSSLEVRLEDLESSKTWGYRLIIGGFFTGVVWILRKSILGI